MTLTPRTRRCSLLLVSLLMMACAHRQKPASASAQEQPRPAPPPLVPPPPPPLSTDEGSPYFRPEVADLREEAHDVLQQQSELAWKNWISGEEVDLDSTYKGHEQLFSLESISTVRRARAEAKGDAARALGNLELYLTGEVLAKETAAATDEALGLEAKESVTLGDVKYAYHDLEKAMAAEPGTTQRAKIYAAETAVLARLNPILERRQARLEAGVKTLGFPSYAQLGGDLRDVDLDALGALAERTLQDTQALYTDRMGQLTLEDLAIPLEKLHHSDIPRLFRNPAKDTDFPGANVIPAASKAFLGLGFELAAQHGLVIDSVPVLRKNPRTVCFPIEVPTDIRVSVKPRGGADDYRSLFHELGHAEHSLNTKRTEWEFQQLGNSTVGEAFAFLLEGIVDKPEWLQTATPLKGDALTRFVKRTAVQQLYTLRRYAAKVLFNLAWHGGKLKEPPADAYRKAMSRAYGFPATEDDGKHYLVDEDDFYASADYLRAWFLAAQINRYLTGYYGARWWESAVAGAFLQGLWADGTRPTADEVARHVGSDTVNPTALEKSLADRLKK